MRYKRINIEFTPLKLSRALVEKKQEIKKFLYQMDCQPSLGKLKNEPPVIKLDWFHVFKHADKVHIELNVSDIFSIEGIEEYREENGKNQIRKMILDSHLEVVRGYEIAKKLYKATIPSLPSLDKWKIDSVLYPIEELLKKEL
jgi:hypothetical protein